MRTRGWTVLVTVLTGLVLGTPSGPAAAAAPVTGVSVSGAPVADALPADALPVGAPAEKMRLELGNDVSWPQCGERLPRNQAFAVVGLNGGLANDTNPCFARQMRWAAKSTGVTGQPRVALYVNTANPGHAGSWWPTSNAYGGRMIWNPYGICTGAEDRACAYMYGYAKAYDNVKYRGVAYPSSYLWWLDVETINTWSSDRAANAAALEGMTAYYQGIGARVGLYSTAYQWSLIVGPVGPTSNLRGLPSWLAGANGPAGAKGMCSWPPLTPDGEVTMTQFVMNDLDYNHSCI